jgi:hypothetical protein
MASWFRSWHGAPTDNKWLVIASRANVAPGIVSAVYWALLDHASQADERGSIAGFDVETYCAFSRFPESDVTAVLAALHEKNVIGPNDRLTAWDKRQPKREDDSSDRVRDWRAKQRSDVPPALPQPVTSGNAMKRSVTHGNNTEEIQNRTDTDTEQKTEEIQNRGRGEQRRAAVATAPVYEAFQQARGGAVNPMDGEQLGELEALYGSDTTVQAIKWCNEHKDRSFLVIGYIAKTLAGWQRDGNVPQPRTNGNGKTPTRFAVDVGSERIYYRQDGAQQIEERREPLG